MNEAVYFIRAEKTGSIKIGYTRRLRARIAAIKNGNSEPLAFLGAVVGSRNLEARLHAEFRTQRLSGEWFRESPALIARIDAMLAERGIVDTDPVPRGTPDRATRRAIDWLQYLERKESERHGRPISEIRGDLAQRIGIAPGTIETIKRGRVERIAVADYEAIRVVFIETAERELRALEKFAAEIGSEAAAAQLATAKTILAGK